ncbi:restriction endonuclease subunit S [Deinococcus sp. 6GRE01]|uniref:restriction endonuclease subunit S n=1 Tax=Deinococcus sp. 6GRE01 TaxID=2745873 RepID=UPI001E3E8DC1|nr:restriction endonuclease subunit S [Deinococcus sp. 6GRE01]MCD0155669.1 restriction endonuclease subunit S [Deinococcus sp. 6GRE01]
MNSKWFKTTISDQAPLQRGFDITQKTANPGDVPVISSGGISYYTDNPILSGPGVVIGRKGTLGTVFYVASNYWPSDTTLWITDFKGNNPKFVYYFYKTLSVMMLNLDVGSANPTLNRNHLHSREILWTDRQSQDRIAEILSSFDDKIELNRQMNRTLEQIARALFKSWFIDFDPVHAKQRGEQPAGMDAETAALFPDRFVEIDGKEVPEGWEIAKLGKLIDLDKGVSYKGEFLSQSGIPMLNLGTFFAKAGFKPSGIKYYTGDYKNKHTVEAGDIIIANTDLTQRREIIGSPAIVPKGIGSGDIIFTHHTFAMRNRGLAGQQFIYHIMQTEDYRERVIGHAHGTTVLAVKKDSLLDLEIILPSGEIVDRFCIQASALYNCAEQNGIEIAHLTQVRDSLLPRLLSGELDVSDWENAVEGL